MTAQTSFIRGAERHFVRERDGLVRVQKNYGQREAGRQTTNTHTQIE